MTSQSKYFKWDYDNSMKLMQLTEKYQGKRIPWKIIQQEFSQYGLTTTQLKSQYYNICHGRSSFVYSFSSSVSDGKNQSLLISQSMSQSPKNIDNEADTQDNSEEFMESGAQVQEQYFELTDFQEYGLYFFNED